MATLPQGNGSNAKFAEERRLMVESQIRKRGVTEDRVLHAMATVPRHEFVPPYWINQAYADEPLPIGYGQTISQPYVVARMSEALLAAGPAPKVLEIGTGCGYQTAVLSPLVREIYTIERIGSFVARARRALRELKIRNVHFRHDDGNVGWPGRAPFDGILLTAAPHKVPQALFDQLAVGGRLIAPVGPDGRQELLRYTKSETRVQRESLGLVSFVPLLSGLQR